MPETLEECDRILIAAGYRQFPKSAASNSHVKAFYQKRVSDDIGVKFFLDCYLYERHEEYPINSELFAYFKGQNAAYQLMEYAKDSFDLAATESLFLALWKAGGFNYIKS
jgi:hypothetical protein